MSLVFDGRGDRDHAMELMRNSARQKIPFNIKESGAAAALCRLVRENVPDGLEHLCAVFFMSTDPLALMLSGYEALKDAALEQRLADPHLAQELSEAASYLATMATGLIFEIGKVQIRTQDKTSRQITLFEPLTDLLRLPAAYVPERRIDNLGLALSIPCKPLLAGRRSLFTTILGYAYGQHLGWL